MSRLFQTVKAAVTARQAAEMYGLKVVRNSLACCPFHHDKTPSMKVDDRYYCFGCGVTGDAVDLTAQLLGLSPKDAALRLAADFGIEVDDKAKPKAFHPYRPRADPQKELQKWFDQAWDILLEYRSLLRDWEKRYAPQSMDEEWHPLFCEALDKKDYIDYLLDELMLCSKDQFEEMRSSCGKEVEKIGKRLGQLARGNAGRDRACPGIDGGSAEGSGHADKEKLCACLPRGSDPEGCVPPE